MVEQDPKLGQLFGNKIYLDMLAACYDKITDKEAAKYYHLFEADTVDCDSAYFRSMLPCDVMKYQNWKSENDLKANVHQIVLSNSLKVNLTLFIPG